jgi:chaperone modulatory protein CbpM
MSDEELEILEGACLTLEQFCSAGTVDRAWLLERVEAGLVPAAGGRFAAATLVRVRRMREIERAYDATPELAALVADLLEEMDRLRKRRF